MKTKLKVLEKDKLEVKEEGGFSVKRRYKWWPYKNYNKPHFSLIHTKVRLYDDGKVELSTQAIGHNRKTYIPGGNTGPHIHATYHDSRGRKLVNGKHFLGEANYRCHKGKKHKWTKSINVDYDRVQEVILHITIHQDDAC